MLSGWACVGWSLRLDSVVLDPFICFDFPAPTAPSEIARECKVRAAKNTGIFLCVRAQVSANFVYLVRPCVEAVFIFISTPVALHFIHCCSKIRRPHKINGVLCITIAVGSPENDFVKVHGRI
jgi:hypothetical protein